MSRDRIKKLYDVMCVGCGKCSSNWITIKEDGTPYGLSKCQSCLGHAHTMTIGNLGTIIARLNEKVAHMEKLIGGHKNV